MLSQIGPDITLVSETWERQKFNLDRLISSNQVKVISYKRQQVGNRQPGGGCAIVYNENKFRVSEIELFLPEGVEACWALFTPKSSSPQYRVKRIAVGTFYIAPNSKFKDKTIEHIIESIHIIRAMYDNDVHFLLGGDLNRVNINRILDSYGALKQIISIPTRNSATLELLITDMHSFYHPPTTLPPLQVDEGKKGKDSDHKIVIMAPLMNDCFKIERKKKTITVRPLPHPNFEAFGQEITQHGWSEVLKSEKLDDKVTNFHHTIRTLLDKHFPEKQVKISTLDKKWMSPGLKSLHRKVQREFYKHRQSAKWRKLKKKYKRLKRKSIKSFYNNFLTELKKTDPGKWYQMAKKIGAVDQMNEGEISVECLEGLSSAEGVQQIANHYATISNNYSPIDTHKLPCYLPAPLPPQVDEYRVFQKICKLKNTRSTLEIDLPNKLRKEFSVELATPVTNIINTSLNQQSYPTLWKKELITPVPKVTHPKKLKDLRKISSTSDFSKVYEGFLRDWLMEDICENIDPGQFGGLKGSGTEHMLVCLVDRILYLLDAQTAQSAVIAAMVDWSAAFDMQDPTLAIQKFIKMGVRSSLIPLLISYLSDRQMRVRFNGEISDYLGLVGGGPQGTLLGLIEYLVQSNDNANCVNEADRFKYVDDLSILELISLAGLLVDYNFHEHVASDVGCDQLYLPPHTFNTQGNLDSISEWTDRNLMKVNTDKTEYMVFTRTVKDFVTRLKINGDKLDQVSETKVLGVWLTENLSWSLNTTELCRKAYSRMSMLTKLKYAGVETEDLLDVYKLFIRSLIEYCSVVWHSRLTVSQTADLERVQKICLKVILSENYVSYEAALEMTGLEALDSRREARCLSFAKKCIKHPKHKAMFPLNPPKSKEKFVVNFARTETYRQSAIPYIQRMLNREYK